jgi:hypothetical protein
MNDNSLGDEPMIIMRLTRTNVFTRWPCHICGGETEKVATLCEGVDADGTRLRCCEVCIRGGQSHLDERIRNNIASLEQHVEFLRTIVGRISIPTYAEWEVAEEAFDDECRSENGEAELSVENVGALFDEEALQRHAERRERGERIADFLAEALKPLAAEVPADEKVYVSVRRDIDLVLTAAGVHKEDSNWF